MRRLAGVLIALGLCAGAALSLAGGAVTPTTPRQGLMGGAVFRDLGEPAPAELARIQARARAFDRAHPTRAAATPKSFPFYPQAGQLWQDLFTNNFVDLDPSSGILDWDCSAYTYDGHNGHDTDLRSFSEKRIGVPVFAALDGTVVDTHDGEPDENVTARGQPANYVAIDHGGGHVTVYFHLKKGSVAVSNGQAVAAGQQIGETASSGNSTWAHLHFGTSVDGTVYDPSAGPCGGGYPPGSGQSKWVHQVAIRRDTYLRGFDFSAADYDGARGDPWDEAVRTSAFPKGVQRWVYFRVEFGNIPPNTTWKVTFRKPNGSPAPGFPATGSFGNAELWRDGWLWYVWILDLTNNGTWHMQLEFNDVQEIDAPFEVSNSGVEVNDPPSPITLAFDPPAPSVSDAVFCNVQGRLDVRDPDYDLVRYHYRWLVDNTVVRELDSAALSDAIARGVAPEGSTVKCEVTPNDGTVDGATASASVVVQAGAPTIDSFAPTSGITGSKFTVTGTNLADTTKATLNGKNARFSVLSPTKVRVTVPNGATTGKVGVETPNGSATSSDDFTVTLSITKLQPRTGPVGTPVTLTGVGFTGVTAVKFNGVTASFTIVSDTKITTTVPAGATTGPVTATGSLGTVQGPKFTVT